MARSDQRAGKFSNLGSTGYGKGCARRGGGRVKGEGRGGFARVHPGGYVFSRLCDVFSFSCWSKSEISRYEQMSKVSRRLSLSQPRSFVEFCHVLPENLPRCLDTQRRLRFRENTFGNRFVKTIHGRLLYFVRFFPSSCSWPYETNTQQSFNLIYQK